MTEALTDRWAPTPSGWVEVAALIDDDEAGEHWRAMVEPARETIGDQACTALDDALARAAAAVPDAGWSPPGSC